MSQELRLTAQVTYAKGNDAYQRNPGNLAVDVSGVPRASQVQTIGFAAHEALLMGDVATAGYAFFRNLDSSNFVLIGRDDGGTFREVIKLRAGQWAVVPLGINAPYAKADTAACNLEYCIFSV